MSGNLMSRVEKLEAKSGASGPPSFRLIRLCTTDDDVASAYQEAERCGISKDQVQIIRLVPLEGKA